MTEFGWGGGGVEAISATENVAFVAYSSVMRGHVNNVTTTFTYIQDIRVLYNSYCILCAFQLV
jgi:hypothetical protein